MKTTSELLKPRYKVMADYPDSHFHIGDIVSQDIEEPEMFTIKENPYKHFIMNPEMFPALFKALEWWEERTPEEMPAYLKATNGLVVVSKVKGWLGWGKVVEFYEGERVRAGLTTYWLPATEQEYNDYISSLTPQSTQP